MSLFEDHGLATEIIKSIKENEDSKFYQVAHPLAVILALRDSGHPDTDIVYYLENSKGLTGSAHVLKQITTEHTAMAETIFEHYAMKFAGIKILSGDLSPWKKCIAQLHARFSTGNFEITKNEMKAIWRLPYFYEEDLLIDKLKSSHKNAVDESVYMQGGKTNQVKLTPIAHYTKMQKKWASHVIFFEYADGYLVRLATPLGTASPFLDYIAETAKSVTLHCALNRYALNGDMDWGVWGIHEDYTVIDIS